MKAGLKIVVIALLAIAVLAYQGLMSVKHISAAYLYGYPLLVMDKTHEQMLASGGVNNQFVHVQDFPDHDFRGVVRPNNDTLYSSAWIDLSEDAVVLGVPDTNERYYVMPLMDMWSNVFATVGKRETGTEAANYLITGPNWQGNVPAGVQIISAPTNTVWLIGRIQTNGKDDIAAVASLQQRFSLTPLQQWQNGVIDNGAPSQSLSEDDTASPNDVIAAMSPLSYFAKLAELLKTYSAPAVDHAMGEQLKYLGIEASSTFGAEQFGFINGLLADFAVTLTRTKIAEAFADRELQNGWGIAADSIANFGTDYAFRAAVAMVGLGALPVQEAMYPSAVLDADGKPFTGAERYKLHFDSAEIPPVDAFWSLTMYDEQGFLIANPIGRYAIGDRDKLQYNPDGSLDILIQHQQPENLQSNWLPAPPAAFALTMRLYLPRQQILNGQWQLPAIRRVAE